MVIDGYEVDESSCREEEKIKEKEVQIEEEEAQEKVTKTPKYV